MTSLAIQLVRSLPRLINFLEGIGAYTTDMRRLAYIKATACPLL